MPFFVRLNFNFLFFSLLYVLTEEAQQMWVRVNDAFDKRNSLELFCTVARYF